MKQFLFCLTISLYGSILAEESSVVINTISRPISHLGLLLSLYFMAMVAQPIQKDSV